MSRWRDTLFPRRNKLMSNFLLKVNMILYSILGRVFWEMSVFRNTKLETKNRPSNDNVLTQLDIRFRTNNIRVLLQQ